MFLNTKNIYNRQYYRQCVTLWTIKFKEIGVIGVISLLIIQQRLEGQTVRDPYKTFEVIITLSIWFVYGLSIV